MNVIVNKKSLVSALVEAIVETEDGPEFERVNVHEDEPIVPSDMMSTQLADAMPPVGDPEFIPASIEELSNSAKAISLEVPLTQIDYFYRKLHEILDSCLDREAEKAMQIENIIRNIISESGDIRSNLLKRASDRAMSGQEDSYDIAIELIENYPEFENDDPVDLQSMIDNADLEVADSQDKELSEPDTKTSSASDEESKDNTSQESDDLSDELSDDEVDAMLGAIEAGDTEENLAVEIVDLIVKKRLHLVTLKDPDTGSVEMVPVVAIDPKTGNFKLSDKEMRVIASEDYGWEIIKNSLEYPDIKKRFDKLSKMGSDKKAYIWLYSNLNDYLGKEGNPVSSELGAEMYANQIADTIGKYGEAVKEQLLAMADQAETKTKDVAVQIGKGKMIKKGSGDWDGSTKWEEDLSDVVRVTVPPGEMAAALRLVADQRLEAPKMGRPRIYDKDEPREAMTPEMRKQIRAERRKAELELEYEPGKMHLSPKALRAMMDKIAADLGQKLGNVRNVIYDDLKVYGLPAEDLRKMIQVDKMPGGREKIPFTYDPLRVQAKEKIVEKLYDMYRNAMMSYVEEVANSEDEEDKDIGTAYRDLFFGEGGLYQPGLDGYINLQSQVGGPTMDDPDSVDVDDITFRTKRKAYDFIQEFIDQVAKEWLDPQSQEYKQAKEGGMRAFLNSLVNDETFSDVGSRSDIDKIIDSETSAIESSMDSEKLKDIIDVVFDKAPKRTKKYIARVKKELGK